MNIEKIKYLKNDAKLGAMGLFGIFFLIFITNPVSVPIAFVLVMPILVASTSFVVTRFFLRLLFEFNNHQITICSYMLAGGVLLVLMLGSLKQLGLQDVILSLLLASGLAFYFTRSSEDTRST